MPSMLGFEPIASVALEPSAQYLAGRSAPFAIRWMATAVGQEALHASLFGHKQASTRWCAPCSPPLADRGYRVS